MADDMTERRDSDPVPLAIERRIAALEAALQTLQDKEAIRQVLVRWCRANDRADLELLRRCYHPGAVDRSGPFEGTAEQLAPRLIEAGLSTFESMFWTVAETDIQIDGDSARVEAYHISAKVMRERDEDGRRVLRLSGVRFLDRFERREREWRIAARKMVSDWGVYVPTPTQSLGPYKIPPADHGFTVGVAGKADPSYHF